MQRFKNILVAVDLSQQDRFVGDELAPPTAEAVDRAIWLAKVNSAKLTFFYTLDVSAHARHMIEAAAEGEQTVMTDAKEALGRLVDQAAAAGVSASLDVEFGKSWVEIIRQVMRGKHDLLVAGTRHFGALQSFFMGSTGIKLLRKCPCPVWITQPQRYRQIRSILVAHCLRPVGDLAMELGCLIAQTCGAQLRVVHALELPPDAGESAEQVSPEELARLRAQAEQHIEAQLREYEFARPPVVHIVTDAPDFAVLTHIEKYGVELTVMGTIARRGVPGIITGNTAEVLLPRLRCSVLAVKPPDFQSPVSL
ncbi:MAG: hypothetical protein DWQ37_03295 [Planctomycetota bacterium]|nr:MAG: hypothetical protein DWQ37_03295 [Planctomycetota bacterium]